MNSTLRSARWFEGKSLPAFLHRSALRSEGLAEVEGKPIVGICNSWSETVNCNIHFRSLANAVKRGVTAAGGLALEFPTLSLSEQLMKPTTMLYRNLMAMDVEESIRSHPFDAVVLIGGCDKTIPAQLLGAASADVPAIVLTGGSSQPAYFRGRELGVGTDIWKYTDELRAGRMTEAEYQELEASAGASAGHCPEMGTASTMTSLCEALGIALPGSSTISAVAARRQAVAELTGRRAVELALEDLRPSRILDERAFANALVVLAAIGGSTNAIVHLLALARRLGIKLDLEDFDRASARTPLLVNMRPSGEHLSEQFHHAGGVRAVMRELGDLIDHDALCVTGRRLGEELPKHGSLNPDVIATPDSPIKPAGGLGVVRGSLAPDGAVIKVSAASPELLNHRGKALVFENVHDVSNRIDDPDLPVDADTVLVLRNSGPKGAPGMPEWGMLPLPKKLLAAGVRDMVRISDARMSGTAFGTAVLHVAPESAVGGPLALVRDGDEIELNLSERRLDLLVSPEELDRRRKETPLPEPRFVRGYGAMYLDHVLQADEGCDFDFLAKPEERYEPEGVYDGWVGGW